MFFGKIAVGTAAGFASWRTMGNPLSELHATPVKEDESDAERWFKTAKGKHRIVYDASEPHDGYPFIWSWVFYKTNNETGTPDHDMTAMVVLRHNAMPFALHDDMWKKYRLGEFFKVKDNTTQRPSLRNLYYVPREGDFPAPGIEGMKTLYERGAMFCVCNMALYAYSMELAHHRGLKQEEIYADWKQHVLPGVQVVPSGVWAIARAQEHNFAYCYAGG